MHLPNTFWLTLPDFPKLIVKSKRYGKAIFRSATRMKWASVETGNFGGKKKKKETDSENIYLS